MEIVGIISLIVVVVVVAARIWQNRPLTPEERINAAKYRWYGAIARGDREAILQAQQDVTDAELAAGYGRGALTIPPSSAPDPDIERAYRASQEADHTDRFSD